MLSIFEIVGMFVRYLFMNTFYRIFNRKRLRYFMEDKKGQIFNNINKDYLNGVIGFITFALLLFFAYSLFG